VGAEAVNWSLAYDIALAIALVVTFAWAFDARRLMLRALRLVEMRDGPPTEEMQLPPTMRIGPRAEDFGPGKPVPRSWE
jgi:hypothetical protein